jgi:hypothetical protein
MAGRTTIREVARLPRGVEAVVVASDDVDGAPLSRRIERSDEPVEPVETEPPRTVTLFELIIRGSTAPGDGIES